MRNLEFSFLILLTFVAFIFSASQSLANEFKIYGVYNPIFMGEPNEKPLRDIYVNIGVEQGIQSGSLLKVYRKISTYDLVNKKLYKDLMVPIAELKVIHAETGAAIARLEKMLPPDSRPGIQPEMVIVGDFVRKAQ